MAQTPLGDFSLKYPQGYTFTDNSGLADNISNVVSNIIGFITLIAGVSFLIFFMLGAINWITSGGDPQKAQTARTRITNSLWGLFIAVAAYPIASILTNLVGIPLAEPADLLNNLIF